MKFLFFSTIVPVVSIMPMWHDHTHCTLKKIFKETIIYSNHLIFEI
jgi:hypothetical protein